MSKYTVTEVPKESKDSKVPQYIAAAAVTLGGFSMGNALGWSSPALPSLERDPDFSHLSPSDLPWIGSLLTVGAAIAALLSGISVEFWGRKPTMLVSSLFFFSGWCSIAFAQNEMLLFLGRFLTGLGVGTLSLAAPVFLAEISQSEVRGVIGVAFQLMVVFGALFSVIIGSLSNWRWLSGACGIIPILFAIAITFIPESPRFLVRKGKLLEGQKALNWYRSCDNVDSQSKVSEEFDNIQESVASTKSSGLTLSTLLSPSVLKPILITMSLVLFNQICGISAVNFYTVTIFDHAQGFLDSNLSAVIVQIVQVLAVLLSSALVDRAGRRILLLLSFAIMFFSLAILGLFFHVKNPSVSVGWLPLCCVILYNVGYSIGIGSLVWTVMSELLPSNVVGVVYALETSYNWTLAFVITRYFHVLKEALNMESTFWIFALCCLISGFTVWLTVPETKGKSLEQIQEEYFKEKRCKSQSKADLVGP